MSARSCHAPIDNVCSLLLFSNRWVSFIYLKNEDAFATQMGMRTSVMVLDRRKCRKPSMLVLSLAATLDLLLLLLLVNTIDGGATSASSCLSSEASILLRIKEGLHLSNGRLSSWGGNESNCCLWEGAECDPQTGRIIGLQLHGRTTSETTPRVFLDIDPELEWHEYRELKVNGHSDPRDISGPRVPPALFELRRLQSLDLSGCDFNGSAIPSQLAQLTHLTHLNLSRAWFSDNLALDDVEGFVKNFKHLKYLHLDYVHIKLRNSQTWRISLSTSLPNLLSLSLAVCDLHGSLSPHIFRLPHLQAIDLSYNFDLNGTLMPSFFPSKSNLQSLRLPHTGFSGHIPSEVFELPLLKVLDLNFNFYLSGPSPTKLPKSNLQILKLSMIRLSGGLPNWIGNLTSLVEQDLSRTDLSGSFPVTIGNLRCLRSLDLWLTNLSGNLPTTIGDLTDLTHLDLHNTGLSGNLPITMANLTALTHLDLSYTALSGNLPITMANLTALTHLSLSSTRCTTLSHLDLRGCKFSSVDSTLFANLTHLAYLDLSGNMFSGSLPSLPYHLRSAHLSHNNFSGSIPHSYNLLNIELLDLSSNSMTGTLPSSLTHGSSFMQFPIQYLDLSNNRFHGYLNLGIFANLKNLYFLSLSGNNWTVDVHNPTLKFPSLQELRLASCNISQLPHFLHHHKPFKTLDLSKNLISGEIPKWLRLSTSLIISYNMITSIGEETFLNIEKVDLSYNKLNRLPKFLSPSTSSFDNMVYFSVKNNSVMGEIPASLCNFTMLLSLDLLNNKFNGQIPDCLLHMDLVEVKLQNNQLQGQIPEFGCHRVTGLRTSDLSANMFESGVYTRTGLRTLDLSDNRFVGYIPTSLGSCKNLEFIDVGYNKLSGEFPWWLAKLPQLKILVLRSNSLNGAINSIVDKNVFQELLVLDISTNQFSGKFPLGLMGGGTIGSKESELTNGFYEDWEVTLNTKGINLTYERGMLSIMKTIEVSNNYFEDGISEEIGDLKGLQALRISNNKLKGPIPKSIGALTHLESLDLSHNYLSGEIPEELTTLNSLGYLNLSYNNLSGRIPQSSHFSTFDALSFVGNPSLCGPPLSLACEGSNGATLYPFVGSRDTDEEKMWKYISMGLALTHLDLHGIGLSGNLPFTMSNLTALTHLDLSYTALSGNLPITMANLTALTHLDISGTRFSGSLPILLGRLTTLSHLDLRGCKFTRIDSSLFANLTHLTYLDLSRNMFSGSLPSLPYHLHTARLSHNNFSGPIPNSYNLPNIEILDLSRNSLTGTLPSSLTHGSSFMQSPIQYLDLSNNRFHGYLNLGIFAHLKNLNFLSLSKNNWTADVHDPTLKFPSLLELRLVSCNINQLPQFLRHHKPIETLDLSKNLIFGEIPKWLNISRSLNISQNMLTSIEQGVFINTMLVDLSFNMLNGNLNSLFPSSGSFGTVEYFSISNNNLTGEMPASLCTFALVQLLDLSNNKLSGEIPNCLFNLTLLVEVKLQNNQLQGQIPELQNWTRNHLSILDLSDNRLQGDVPTSLEYCKDAEFINLGHNKLSGGFPSWL
ncbi:Receptor-like protein 12 [Nymphaea thermarum]|nr:Receptor-like protein 12 [Nymphaea thermarum]